MLYNVRVDDGYDPRAALPVAPFAFELQLEPSISRRPLRVALALAGPATRQLIRALLEVVPAAELDTLTITARAQSFRSGDFPRQTPATWHTDYARELQRLEPRLAIHTYAVCTAPPLTLFLQRDRLQLPEVNSHGAFAKAIVREPMFEAAPWTLVRFNGTEVHTAVRASTVGERLFVRATFGA